MLAGCTKPIENSKILLYTLPNIVHGQAIRRRRKTLSIFYKKRVFILILIGLLIVASAFLYLEYSGYLFANAAIEEIRKDKPPGSKEVLFSLPLNDAKGTLGIRYSEPTDSYEYPAAIAVKNSKIYVADPINYRIVVLNANGKVIDEIKLPEKKAIMDIAVDDKENLYAVNYIDSKLYIYNFKAEKFKTITGFAGPHLVDVFKDCYYVLDFNPKKNSELRLQAYTANKTLISTKAQVDLDLNLYTIQDYENNTISFDIVKGQGAQLAEKYEIIIKNKAAVINRVTYIPNNPVGAYYKSIRLLGIDQSNRLYILRSAGPKFEKDLTFYQIQDRSNTYVDVINTKTGKIATHELEKDYALYGPGVTSDRFVIDEDGSIYQAQITKKEFKIIKYYFIGRSDIGQKNN